MKIKNVLILLCLFGSFAQANLSDLIHTDPWNFLKDKFITAPKVRAAEITPKIVKSLTGLGIGVVTHFGALSIYKHYKRQLRGYSWDDSEYEKYLRCILNYTKKSWYIMPLITGYLSYNKVHKIFIERYQREQLKNLLDTWPQIKSRIPSELRSGLEAIYNEYKVNPEGFTHNFDDIVRVILLQINEKLTPKTSKQFWGIKIPSSNALLTIGNTLASLTRIFR